MQPGIRISCMSNGGNKYSNLGRNLSLHTCLNVFILLLSLVGLAVRFRRSTEEPLSSTTGSPTADESKEIVFEAGILNQYTIHLHFDLPENLSIISKASLLLHQLPVDTVSKPILDDEQLVQIRAIINNTRYFVDKKKLSVYGYGPQSFNALRAVEVWVEGGRVGEVTLEVLVTCSSSPNCSALVGEQMPATVEFLYNATDTSQVPRVIILSRNPLEANFAHSNLRRKRRAAGSEQYCHGEETTCCLHPLTINFERDLGIDFIHLPINFTTNYCEGFCPQLSSLGVSRSNLLLELQGSTASSVAPCCTGVEYKPLHVLIQVYNRDRRVHEPRMDILEQVTVTKCKCS